MPIRYVYWKINEYIENVWNKSKLFWNQSKFKIKKETTSESGLYRLLKIRHHPSGHIYGYSFGEDFTIRYAYSPEDNITYIEIKINFSLMGKGFVWKVPTDIIKQWAIQMGVSNFQFNKGRNCIDQSKEFNEILEIIKNKKLTHHMWYCPRCGCQNDYNNSNCQECGSEQFLSQID